MNKFYTFFNYNWFKIIKNNIKNNKKIELKKEEKTELSKLILKKEICGIIFVILNFTITYTTLIDVYKSKYNHFILFRILKDNFLTSIIWFIVITILPTITSIMISKKLKAKNYLLLSLIYIISNIINILMTIYFITEFINNVPLGIIGIINIIITIIINSNIIIKINENYLK